MMVHVAVGTATGLHMRAAARVAGAAAEMRVPVTVRAPGRDAVPADSVLALLTLGAAQGAELVLEADGEGAEAALARLAELLSRNLDSDPGRV